MEEVLRQYDGDGAVAGRSFADAPCRETVCGALLGTLCRKRGCPAPDAPALNAQTSRATRSTRVMWREALI